MWGLGKVILKHISTIKEFVIEKSFCRLIRLELVGLESFENWVTSQGVDHMFPLLQVLIIRECPKLLELPFSNHCVDPKPDQGGDIDWFPKLQELQVQNCPEFLLVAHIPWTETLQIVNIRGVRLLEELNYSKSSYKITLRIVGKDVLQSLDQVLAFSNLTVLEELSLQKCPPLELKHLLMLTSLKMLLACSLDGLVGDVCGLEWQHALEHLVVKDRESRGKELTELLSHFPMLSALNILGCKSITRLAVAVDVQLTMPAAALEVEQEKVEDELLLLPAHLCDSLRKLFIGYCPGLVLVDSPSTSLPARGGGGLQVLRSLQSLEISNCPKILSAGSLSRCPFPSSLQELTLSGMEGMGTLEPLSNLTSLTLLKVEDCGEGLRCKGLGPLLTTGGQLRKLIVYGSPGFFPGWDPNVSSSNLQELYTDEATGLLAGPICSLLSSSLTYLFLNGSYQEMDRFTNEQEDCFHMLASLQKLHFWDFKNLQNLPAGLHKLTNLKCLQVCLCPAVRSLPKDGLPKSLQELNIMGCGNEELKQQCKGLVRTIPNIVFDSPF